MSFPPSKLGDKYNNQVAAYLKVKGLPELGSQFDFKNANVDPNPDQISSKTSLFETKLSFDIIVTSSKWEFLIECKRIEAPKSLSINSVEFKEGLVEFISSYPLRESEYKEYKYLFITSGNTKKLSEEIQRLKIAKDSTLLEYLNKIKNQAIKKWENPNVHTVTVTHLRICLNDLVIKTIELSEMQSLEENNKKFNQILQDFYSKIGEKLEGLPPTLPTRTKIALLYNDNDYFETKWSSYPVSISKEFIDKLSQIKSINKITEIPFVSNNLTKHIKIIHDKQIREDQIDAALSISINKKLIENNTNFIVVISSFMSRLYICDPFWLCKEVSSLQDANNQFNLTKISESLSLPLSGHLLRIAIQESYVSAKGGLYYATDFFYD